MTSQHSRNGCEGSPARCAGWAAFVVFAADPAETDVQNEQEGSNLKMRGHSRRLLSVLLALVMLLSLLPTAVFAATPKAKLVTDASELKAGDQIILTATANSKTYVAGSLSGKYLTSIETDPADPAANVEVFTLGGKAGAWTLTASDGKQIYTAAAKALNNAGKGTGT